jgi:hypothetical protein
VGKKEVNTEGRNTDKEEGREKRRNELEKRTVFLD